jgi:serine O-acetyltransferase
MFARLREDIACILERDPAARTTWEVLTCYPGLHALVLHRRAHWCWTHGLKWPGRFISHLSRWLTGIEIHPGATIGHRVFIDHGMGIVIGEIRDWRRLHVAGVTSGQGRQRHPTLEVGVIADANAAVLGGFTVGAGARTARCGRD